LETFFQKMDTDGDGKLSGTEIVEALCNACKNKVSDRLENFKDELQNSTEAVTLDKFKEIAHRMSIATRG
jgi:Ca2+-binding EF-hand superfamily protein